MARLNVNPTRMELTRLKSGLTAALRGHRLLKDKCDELMRQFMELVRESKLLRKRVELQLSAASRQLALAGAIMQKEVVQTALLMPKQKLSAEVFEKNIMSVKLPVLELKALSYNTADIFPYGYVYTSGVLDSAVAMLSELLPDMLRLAECEKSVQLLSAEIEKTRRRVNALEYFIIPNYQDTIKYISMKLDENERSSITGLLKVKDMMVSKNLQEKKQHMNEAHSPTQ